MVPASRAANMLAAHDTSTVSRRALPRRPRRRRFPALARSQRPRRALAQASVARRSDRAGVHAPRLSTSPCNPDPPPRAHLTRYHGVFAPHHHLRAAIVPAASAATAATDPPRPASRRRLDWASLLKRGFATDVVVCDTCGGAMRILAILPEGDASRSILEHLGLPTEPPPPRAVGPTVDVLMAALDAGSRRRR